MNLFALDLQVEMLRIPFISEEQHFPAISHQNECVVRNFHIKLLQAIRWNLNVVAEGRFREQSAQCVQQRRSSVRAAEGRVTDPARRIVYSPNG